MKDIFGVNTFQCFTLEQVKEINKLIKKNIFQKEESDKVAQFSSKTGDFFHVPCPPLMELLYPWMYSCQNLNRNICRYDIDWQFHLDSFNYNVYGEGGQYDWHIDANIEKTQFDMKLTCLLNLSEETYEGGEFMAINFDKKIEFTTGMGLVINSLIAHKVTPVTKGERITLTYWGVGPTWR